MKYYLVFSFYKFDVFFFFFTWVHFVLYFGQNGFGKLKPGLFVFFKTEENKLCDVVILSATSLE